MNRVVSTLSSLQIGRHPPDDLDHSAIDEGDTENNEIRIGTWYEKQEVLAEVRDTGSPARL